MYRLEDEQLVQVKEVRMSDEQKGFRRGCFVIAASCG